MTARYLVGDVFDRMAELEAGSYDLIITSPPFLALRSYLPDGHPDKAKEIGSEATPAAFLDVMLNLTAEWGRLLAPHGSIAIEIGDTYSGSGGAGGDYDGGGLRDGQATFDGSARRARRLHPDADGRHRNSDPDRRELRYNRNDNGGDGWPPAKSLAMIPELYAASLAYGRNLLTGAESPAGRWRVRNFKPWIRSNPPVGALGDKERPATSYITVATRAVDRYFDLDNVRTPDARPPGPRTPEPKASALEASGQHGKGMPATGGYHANGGAPPLDWWHHADAIIDDEIDQRAGKAAASPRAAQGVDRRANSGKAAASERGGNWDTLDMQRETGGAVGARGVHIRRRLEQAGILTTQDALDVSPRGYKGAHYAVWPPELVKRLLQEMAPRRVCTTCGKPSRRIVEAERLVDGAVSDAPIQHPGRASNGGGEYSKAHGTFGRQATTVGWSDCGHGTWRPARILDPFAGSATTLQVATGLGHHADGIDLDPRNAHLARERCGMFLDIIESTSKAAS